MRQVQGLRHGAGRLDRARTEGSQVPDEDPPSLKRHADAGWLTRGAEMVTSSECGVLSSLGRFLPERTTHRGALVNSARRRREAHTAQRKADLGK